jgi:hypothetical protein
MESRLPPHLREELDGLRKYESKILAGLKDADTARLFLIDPRAALNAMKVPLSPAARLALRDARPPASLLEPKGFRLPNGQVVVPKVTIRFVKQEA